MVVVGVRRVGYYIVLLEYTYRVIAGVDMVVSAGESRVSGGKPRPLYIISKIKIENFKNIRKVDLELTPGINIIVGPNASGKTSILEAAYFLYKALVDAAEKTPYRPHAPEYWSGLDLIRGKDPGSNVKIGITLEVYFPAKEGGNWCKAEVEGSVAFAYDSQSDTVLPVQYNFTINHDLFIKIDPHFIEITVDKGVWEEAGKPGGDKAASIREADNRVTIVYPSFAKGLPGVFLHPRFLSLLDTEILKEIRYKGSALYIVGSMEAPFLDVEIPVVWRPYVECSVEARGVPVSTDNIMLNFLLSSARYFAPDLAILLLFEAISRIILLRHPDAGALREPRPFTGSNRLHPRAQNLAEVLLTLQGRLGRMPERLERLVSKAFPDFRVWIDSRFGRVTLMSEWRGMKLPPPNLPDGLIKTLAIGAAAELDPSLLLIDEIENSLHAGLLEVIIDELNGLPVPIIAATHSPIPVDIAGPERTIIVLPGEDGTIVKRIEDPGKLRRMLAEHGITFSDYIYGVTVKD